MSLRVARVTWGEEKKLEHGVHMKVMDSGAERKPRGCRTVFPFFFT